MIDGLCELPAHELAQRLRSGQLTAVEHDAVLTATAAARRAYVDKVPAPADLVNGMHQINGTTAVAGASGWIYFQNTKQPPEWLPYNKAVPILSLDRDGNATLVRLSSRLGIPPGPPALR